MNIFVAGIHAVGKSHLCHEFSGTNGWIHRSASQLIREELGSENWSTDKRVTETEKNQEALVYAVKKINSKGNQLLLDGHFVLKNEKNEFIELESNIFSSLQLSGVILIEADPELIISRLRNRDKVTGSIKDIQKFITTERNQAKLVCSILKIPLIILTEATLSNFSDSISRISNKNMFTSKQN